MKFIFTLILFIATNSFALLGYGTKDISGTSYILTNLGDVKRAVAKKVYLLPFASSAEIKKEYQSKQAASMKSLLEEHRRKICKKFEQEKTVRLNSYSSEMKPKYRSECTSDENQLAEAQKKVDPNYNILKKERESLASKLIKLSDEKSRLICEAGNMKLIFCDRSKNLSDESGVLSKLVERLAAEKENEIFNREFAKVKILVDNQEDGYQTVFINNSDYALRATHKTRVFQTKAMVGDKSIMDGYSPLALKEAGKEYEYRDKKVYIFPPNSEIRSEKKN